MLITRVRAQSDKSDETGFIKATKESNCRFIHKKSKTFKQQKFFLKSKRYVCTSIITTTNRPISEIFSVAVKLCSYIAVL